MFIGRKKEIESITSILQKPNKSIIIYGNRRVGKTSLIEESLKKINIPSINFECVKDTEEKNVLQFCQQLEKSHFLQEGLEFRSFLKLFQYLDSLNKRLIIVIDEYPYLKEINDSNKIDSYFQKIIDKHLKNLNLILLGSHVGMMKDLLNNSSPLFGRFNLNIHLKEFNYLEASLFYKNLSFYEKCLFYSVFGGSPFILSQLDFNKSMEENIIDTLLNVKSSIFLYVSEGITSDLFTKNYSYAIFSELKNGYKKYSDIQNSMGLETNGLLTNQLNNLIKMDFISKDYPINKIDDRKKIKYHINSNFIRFFFCYIYKRINILNIDGPKAFFNEYIKETLIEFCSHSFEEICRQYFSILLQKGIIKNVKNIGRYYYDDKVNKTNGEFDVALDCEKSYSIIETKFLKGKTSNAEIEKEINQIKKITEIDVQNIGFISINGFEKTNIKLNYQIEGKDLFNKNLFD